VKSVVRIAVAVVFLTVGFFAGRYFERSRDPVPTRAQNTPGRYQFIVVPLGLTPPGIIRTDTVTGTCARYVEGRWVDPTTGLPQP
jgi:hypothetical protein